MCHMKNRAVFPALGIVNILCRYNKRLAARMKGHCGRAVVQPQIGCNCLFQLSRLNRLEPVSYTHLDVYKRQLLHNLPEPYKEVFSLRVLGELSYQDIAKLFGKTESWARVTFHRAKLKIIEQVKEESYE